MAPRRSARARGPAADVEMAAAEPEDVDAAEPSAPSAHKSILKKTPSARAPTPTVEHEEEDHFDALFGALVPADATVALVVADWRAKHGADPEAALAELYTLIARAGGCAITITKDELEASTGDDIGARVVSEMVAGNVYADDPMDDSGTPGSRKEKFKRFKRRYGEFWDTLLRDSSETEELFGYENDDETENKEPDIGSSRKRGASGVWNAARNSNASPLFDAVSDAVALFSGSRSRNVRVAATRAGLQLVTSLVKIAKAKADTRDTKQRQLDAESKKKRPNAAMLRALAEALTKTQTRIRDVERMIADAFTKIFTHRFRDVDASLRAACMESIGEWMRAHPLFFLSDVYLKYLGWSLSDKDARVRRAVLSALRGLYVASAENLALMDTFNARFQTRTRDMIHDVDPNVAVEAVAALEALYRAGVLPREDMRPVMMLLLDANGKIRAAAAAVVPALLAGDADAAAEAAALDEYDENIATTTTAAKKKAVRGKASSVSEKDAKTRETLMSLVGIIESLGGSRARAAGAVDALWDEFGDVLSEWGVVFEMFLSDEASARVPGKARGRAGKADPVSESRCGAHLESDEAAGLANLLACASRRALGERLVRPDGAPRPPTKAQRESHERAREAFTQNAMRWLPAALRKWRSDEAVVAPLLETARHLRLEHYSLKRKEHEFDELAKVAGEIFRAHSGRRTMEACAGALHHAVAEGSESLRELAKRRVEASYAESAEKLRAALAETYASKESRKKKNGSSRDTSEDSREDQAQFRVRVELARLNALLSLMPPPSGPNVPIAARDSFEDLVSIVAAAAEGRASVQPRAAALATRGAALALSHALFDLVDRGASNVTADEVKEHVAMRDAFVSSAVALARTSVDALDDAAAAAAAASRGSDSKTPPGPSLLGLRSVPKAAVAAFAHLVVCYQRPRAAAADAAQAEAAKSRRVHGDADGGGGGDDVYPAYASPAPVFAPLEFIPDEDAFRAVWDACNQLLDPPAGAEEDAAPGRRDSEDGDDFGDEESARLAYALACAEAAVGDHRFVAAELLANREQSGRWTDLAISALLGDLRHLGPKAVGDVIFYSLVSAYDEVVSGDTEDPDAVVAMEHAFEEFSARLAHMFNVGSARDRVVCRHVVEEGLKHCIPTASFDQEKLPFLSLGLAAFVPKIAAADAKTFASPLQTVVDAVDAEDRANAPLVDFAERVAARARGAAAPHPARNLAEPAFAHDEDPVDAEPTQDEEPVRAFGAGERRRR